MLPYNKHQFTAKCIQITQRSNMLETNNNVFKTIYDELSIGAYRPVDKKTFTALGQWYYAESYSQNGELLDVFNELYDAILSDECPAPPTNNKASEPETEYLTTQNAYKNEQTPAERIRNIITPFTNLVQLLPLRDKHPFNDDNPIGKIFTNSERICIETLPQIQFYLTDLERFYEQRVPVPPSPNLNLESHG